MKTQRLLIPCIPNSFCRVRTVISLSHTQCAGKKYDKVFIPNAVFQPSAALTVNNLKTSSDDRWYQQELILYSSYMMQRTRLSVNYAMVS